MAAETASTHRAALLHGTHAPVRRHWLRLKALGDSVTSGTFRVAGRDWTVICSFDVSFGLADDVDNGHVDYDDLVMAMASFSIDDPMAVAGP